LIDGVEREDPTSLGSLQGIQELTEVDFVFLPSLHDDDGPFRGEWCSALRRCLEEGEASLDPAERVALKRF